MGPRPVPKPRRRGPLRRPGRFPRSARAVTVHSGPMAVSEQVAYESRVRPRQALIAGAGGLALFAAAVMQASGPQPKVTELTIELITYSRRAGLTVGGAVLNGIGLLLLAATLVFLLSVTRARRPATSRGIEISAIA